MIWQEFSGQNFTQRAFQRLPILILADGLYPYEGFFATCRQYGWEWSTTFKEDNPSSLREEIHALQPTNALWSKVKGKGRGLNNPR